MNKKTIRMILGGLFGGFISIIGFPFYTWQFWIALALFFGFGVANWD